MSDIQIQQTGERRVIESSDGAITVSIPIQIKRRAGRKRITLPNGGAYISADQNPVSTAMQLALVRGYQWAALLESGAVESMRDIAKYEGVGNSYVSRMINLTTLSPEIIAAILDNDLPDDLTQQDLAIDPHPLWEAQWERMFKV